jgi:hypothetical protein
MNRGAEKFDTQAYLRVLKETEAFKEQCVPLFPPAENSAEAWAQRHSRAGHNPRPAPTKDNPDMWECDCGSIRCTLTGEQIRQKFGHLAAARRARAGTAHRDNEQR